jgi:hypothetical protein
MFGVPTYVAIASESTNDVLITDVSTGGIVRLNTSGTETDVSEYPTLGTGVEFVSPPDLMIESNGDILATAGIGSGLGADNGLLRFVPATGDRVVLSSGALGAGVPLPTSGNIYIAPVTFGPTTAAGGWSLYR